MKRQRLMLINARLFAGAALIFFYLTSCTNYWLHAVTCGSDNKTQRSLTGRNESSPMGSSMPENGALQHQRKKRYIYSEYSLLLKDHRLIYHHEGFFWRCTFTDKEAVNQLSKFIIINQPPIKCCVHAFYSPFPSEPEFINAEFQSSLVYREFWTALMFLGVIVITIGFICIIYKAFCQNYRTYKTVGAIFLIGGICFTVSIIMYAFWISAISQMLAKEIANCSSANSNASYGVDYGWSFMAAPFAVLFSVIAGVLFIKLSSTEPSESGSII
ncbi:transmembrane protein 182-like isoform X2 [Rhinoraja longicauda]